MDWPARERQAGAHRSDRCSDRCSDKGSDRGSDRGSRGSDRGSDRCLEPENWPDWRDWGKELTMPAMSARILPVPMMVIRYTRKVPLTDWPIKDWPLTDWLIEDWPIEDWPIEATSREEVSATEREWEMDRLSQLPIVNKSFCLEKEGPRRI